MFVKNAIYFQGFDMPCTITLYSLVEVVVASEKSLESFSKIDQVVKF